MQKLADRAGSRNYVDGNPELSSETVKAQKPLRAAEVVVEEVEGNPGYYNAQLLPAAALPARRPERRLRLVSKLPSAKAA